MTNQRALILLLMRKESAQYHSIERLFESLAPVLSKRFEIKVVRVPCASSGVFRCVRNLIFTARLRADIVHITGDIHYCALAVPRRRCILTIHDLCYANRESGLRRGIFSLLWYRLPLLWASHVTAISEETKRQLELLLPTVGGKIKVISNCVDESFGRHHSPSRTSAEGPQALRVLQVGTGANKNLERVARAASGLPIHLQIIGPLSSGQRALLDSLDLSWASCENVSAEDLILEYCKNDVLVFASTYEGFGLPIIEAQASGLPVITSDMAPMNETAGDGALLVDPYEESEIRTALEQLLYSPELARRLSDLGRRNSERFDASAVGDRYAYVYDLTLSRPRHSIGALR
jgi:glycosyltransferase involved in cell wall biosynthesis